MIRPQLRDSTILVTGGAGFIGSHLVDRLIKEGAKQVIVIDNLFLGRRENLAGAQINGCIIYIDDAEIESSLEYIFLNHKIDVVFNCSTKALNYSFINPSNAYMTNVLVIKNLLEFQRKKYFKTLCHFSTSEVYGSAVYEPMDEDHPLNPTTTYAAGKASADIMLKSYVNMFDLDAFIIRPFNNYGPRQNYEGELAGVIPKTIFRILNGQQPVIQGTGKQTRDFIYVYDTIEAIVKSYGKIQAGEAVNVANNGQISIIDIVEKVCRIMNYNGVINFVEARKADVECHHSDITKMKSLYGEKLTEFEVGLKQTIEWYKLVYSSNN